MKIAAASTSAIVAALGLTIANVGPASAYGGCGLETNRSYYQGTYSTYGAYTNCSTTMAWQISYEVRSPNGTLLGQGMKCVDKNQGSGNQRVNLGSYASGYGYPNMTITSEWGIGTSCY